MDSFYLFEELLEVWPKALEVDPFDRSPVVSVMTANFRGIVCVVVS
jgi:hypothetical protein